MSLALATAMDATVEANRFLIDENNGLLQAIRDNKALIAELREQNEDLREQLLQVNAELEGAVHQNQILEGEKSIHEIQLRMLLAGEETHLSWLRTQKTLFESDAAKSIQSRGYGDDSG